MTLKAIYNKTKRERFFIQIFLVPLLVIGIFCLCAENRHSMHLQNLKSDSIYKVKSAILKLHNVGKEAIPLLIKEIQDDRKLILLLVNPLSSTIENGTINSYAGVLAAYVIELILGREELITKDFFGNSLILGLNVKNYIYYNGRIVKKGGGNIGKSDLLEIKKIYEIWWRENNHKSLEKLRKEWLEGKKPLSDSKYHWE